MTQTSQEKPLRLEATVIKRDDHHMRLSDLSPNTQRVLKTLVAHNYQAYAVGGCVRDRLLGLSPKDFDVVTNATPEQIKACFRNCRLIGRRFRLAHITFGREIIEVATFRGHHVEDAKDTHAKQNRDGQLIRDNIFGTIEEDAARRDFSFNAMYFDATNENILDFANGMHAIKHQQIEMIGDIATRIKEDPVRMLRAARFSIKLNMRIDDEMKGIIAAHAHLLANIPPARLFEEVSKLLLSGRGFKTLLSLQELGLFKVLFPILDGMLNDPKGKEQLLIQKMLKNTDERIANDMRITPAFLYATILWYPMEERAQQLIFDTQLNPHDAMNIASAEIIQRQVQRIMVPKRFTIVVREIWSLQRRLQKRFGKRVFQLLSHPRFRAAYDFLLLRAEVEGGQTLELAQWWTDFQEAKDDKRANMLKALNPKSGKRPRGGKKRTKPKTETGQPSNDV
uniref:polynucleotide adenylyltransferase PcnB n=1 Tax=Ningiella ruwaisensis TaxID=2364274 RepID=UPI0010A07068|nr:polynucleotide adenylyltransferase PcnB [Ningiella ruwaisensis]